MARYKTKLTGAIVHNTLTNKTELKYYYNDKETTQEENIRLKRQLKKIEKKELHEEHEGVLYTLLLDLYSNEVIKWTNFKNTI